MSMYQQPFSAEEIADGNKILTTSIDVGGTVASCSFVNSTPYWFRCLDKSGMVIAFIGPNTKGNENFTMAVDDRIVLERFLGLKPVTSPVSSTLFFIRFNPFDGSGGLSDYNTNTAVGGTAASEVFMRTALPAGTNTIGTVGLASGTSTIGKVGVTELPAIPQLPTSLGTGGHLNTNVMNVVATQLRAGTAAIGTVGVTDLPDIPQKPLVDSTAHIGKVSIEGSPFVNIDRMPPVHLQQDTIQEVLGGNTLVDGTYKTIVTPQPGYVTDVFIQASNVNVMNIALEIGAMPNPTGRIELLPGDTFKITLVEDIVIRARTFGTVVQGDTSVNVIMVRRAAF